MSRVLLFLAGWMLFPALAVAQLGDRAVAVDTATAKAYSTRDLNSDAFTAAPGFHATSYLMSRPEGQESLRRYHELRKAGKLPAHTGIASKSEATLGTQQGFSVFNFDTDSYQTIDFTLKKSLTRYTIWVETALLNGALTDQKIDELDMALGSSTPAGSYDPSNGIIVNDEVVFGNPPDPDGDSKTDILLLDIRDDASQGFIVLGFFDPRDISSGNNDAIIYLDAVEGLNNQETLLATAAHEYQHLIMAAYDGTETTFVNEAQSEWAELMNGYYGRNMAFLNLPSEHGTRFFEYRETTGGIRDRERGQLFTLYLAEQTSTLTAGAITRSTSRAHQGYGSTFVLGSVAAFETMLVDFHVANLYNDTDLGARYGYVNPFYTDVRTSPDLVVDGRVQEDQPDTQLQLAGGTVYYADFENVDNMVVSLDVNPTNPAFVASYRARIEVRALLERTGQPLEEISFTPDGNDLTLSGSFERIRLVVVNKRAQEPASGTVPVLYSASWQTESAGTLVSVQYDDGVPSRDYYTTTGSLVLMTRFAVPDPDRTTLDAVSLSPFYDNQFGNSEVPTDAPRDLKLFVVDLTAGSPDLTKEIFSLVVPDPRPYAPVLTNSDLDHFEVDLSAYTGQLSNLPAEIFIGYTDTGTDDNYMVVGPSVNSVDNVSYIGSADNTGWGPLWDATPDSACCNHRVIPIRAHFLVSNVVGVEDAPVTAGGVTLHPNYPNPFDSSTQLEFEVAAPTMLDIAVFDVLGRQVQTLARGLYPAGLHRVTVDGSSLASGMYFYRLHADGVDAAGTMIRR